MSHPKQLSLKLLLASDLRKLPCVPPTFLALQQLLTDLYGSTDFAVKYTDEEGDCITVGTDDELHTAVATATGPSLKLTLLPRHPPVTVDRPPDTLPIPTTLCSKPVHRQQAEDQFIKKMVISEVSRTMGLPVPAVHPHVECDGCLQYPLTGVRYKCTVCSNFDYCEVCEAQKTHPHPFLQIKEPTADVAFDVVLDCDSIQKSIKTLFGPRKTKGKKLKMMFVRHQNSEELQIAPGGVTEKQWLVKNDGCEPWPLGVTLLLAKGELHGERREIPVTPPGAEIVVGTKLRAPLFEGRYHSIFRLIAPNGKKFGEKLKVRARVEGPLSPEFSEKLEQLRSMGFTDESEIKTQLEACQGDVSLVAARLLPR